MPKAEDNQDNISMCMKFCGSCPTYPGLEGEVLFCARSKSSVPKAKTGCNCGLCDVQSNYGCTGMYYCIEGACE